MAYDHLALDVNALFENEPGVLFDDVVVLDGS